MPLTAVLEVGAGHNGIKFVLGDAGDYGIPDAGDGDIGYGAGLPDGGDLVGGLYGSGPADGRQSAFDADAKFGECEDAVGVHAIYTEFFTGNAELFKNGLEFRGPPLRGSRRVSAQLPELEGVDPAGVGVISNYGGFKAAGLEDYRLTLPGHEDRLVFVAEHEALHEPGAGGVAHVDGVPEEDGAEVGLCDLGLEAGDAVAAHTLDVNALLKVDDLAAENVFFVKLLRRHD